MLELMPEWDCVWYLVRLCGCIYVDVLSMWN